MATATTTHIPERRHIPDRRVHASETHLRAGKTDTSDTDAKRMSVLDWIAMTLLIIGGLNWGLVGLFDFDLVARLFGEMSALSRAIYALVGLSALYSIYTGSKMARRHD